jgi:hypothetical protein
MQGTNPEPREAVPQGSVFGPGPAAVRFLESRRLPDSVLYAAVPAVLLVSALDAAALYVGLEALQPQGHKAQTRFLWMLAAVTPFLLGLVATVLRSWRQERDGEACIGVALAAVAIQMSVGLLLILATVGLYLWPLWIFLPIVVAVAFPAAAVPALLGAWIGYGFQTWRHARRAARLQARSDVAAGLG